MIGLRRVHPASFHVGIVVVMGWFIGLDGCVSNRSTSKGALESPDPAARVAAIVHAAEQDDHSAIPLLVDRLEDEDEAVRFYAIMALDRLTGTRLGYKYGGSSRQRRASVERWRRFLNESDTGGQAVAGGSESEPG